MTVRYATSFLLIILLALQATTAPAQEKKPPLQPEWEKAIEQKLAQRVTLELDHQTLTDCLEFFSTHLELPVVADPQTIQQQQVSLNLKGVPIRTALIRITRPHGLVFRVTLGAIVITSPQRAASLPRTRPRFDPTLTQEQRALQQKLSTLTIPNLEFHDTPFGEVIEYLNAYADCHLVVSPLLAGKKVRISLRKHRLDQFVKLLSWQVGGKLHYRNNRLQIVPADRSH